MIAANALHILDGDVHTPTPTAPERVRERLDGDGCDSAVPGSERLRSGLLSSARRVRKLAAALEAGAMRTGPVERTAVAALRDDVARASAQLLDELERWLTELDEEDW